MKRLLLLTFLCVVPSAHAVDYVKCEAMNAAAGRIKVTAERERVKARDDYRMQKAIEFCGEGSSMYTKCYSDAGRPGWDEGLAAGREAEAAQLARLNQIRKDYDAAGCY